MKEFKFDRNQTFKHEIIRYVDTLKAELECEQEISRYKSLIIAALLTKTQPEKDVE